MFKKYDEYLETVLMIRKTTKIEAILLDLGAKGGDLWLKSDSIRHMLSDDVMVKILHITIVRNHILCGRLEVENIQNNLMFEENKINQTQKLIDECDDVLEILAYQNIYENLKNNVADKLESLDYYAKQQTMNISDGLKDWMNTLLSGNIDNLDSLLGEESARIKELKRYMKKYALKKQARRFGKLMAAVSIAALLYVLLGFLND